MTQRMHHPDFVHLVTNRCERGMFLMKPEKLVVHLIRFWLSRAKQLHGPGIEIYGFCFLSNHFHILLRDPCGELPAFIGYFSGNVAKAVNRVIGRTGGAFWSREYDDKIVAGEDAFLTALAYVLANPVKSGLVDLPSQWKGVSSLENSLHGATFSETGLKVNDFNEARRHGKQICRNDFMETFSFELAAPPMWERHSPDKRTKFLIDLLRGASAQYRKARKSLRAMGFKAVLKQHFCDRPRNFKPRPRCRFLCSCAERQKELKKTLQLFVSRYKACLEIFYKQVLSKSRALMFSRIHWPSGCYPPSCIKSVGF